jgi:predicted dienelactone hydrolase
MRREGQETMKRFFLACLAALSTAAAQASMGFVELRGVGDDGPITVFYPSSSPAVGVRRGQFMLDLAVEGKPAAGNTRLVVVSHGSGGSPWPHSDLARLLVDAGFVVAMPEHRGDNWRDMSQAGPESWKRRPAEVSRAIDAVGRDARFAPLLALDGVGVFGMSAGGHTALSLAGGRWSPALFRQHCEAHLANDFPACVGLATELSGNVLDEVKKSIALAVIRQRFADATRYTHDDPRVRAIVADVPFAADFDMASVAQPRVPLALIGSGRDKWLAPRFHSAAVQQACAPCELLADMPTAGHGALLSPMPTGLPERAAALLDDPPGYDRSETARVHGKVVAFFRQHLLPRMKNVQ